VANTVAKVRFIVVLAATAVAAVLAAKGWHPAGMNDGGYW